MTSSNSQQYSNPTSDPSSMAASMVRSSSTEAANKSGNGSSSSNGGNKRKGTRSVSTLTPSQLARKRANDREAQRAIRARTKEHIERLEKELEELRSQHSRDQTVQDLLRRNRALEDELNQLKETMGVPLNNSHTSPYSTTGTASATTSATTSSMELDSFGLAASGLDGTTSLTGSPFTVYDDATAAAVAGQHSPTRGSPYPSGTATSGGYHHPQDASSLPPDYGTSYVPLPDTGSDGSWPAVPNTISSDVSSPCSSADDYSGAAYIPTSMPSGMLPHSGPGGVVKMEYEDGEPQQQQQQQQPQALRHWVPAAPQQQQHASHANPSPSPSAAAAAAGYARSHQPHVLPRSTPAQHALAGRPRVPHVLPSATVPGSLSQPPPQQQTQQQPQLHNFTDGVTGLWQLPLNHETSKSRGDELLLDFVQACRRQPRMDAVRMMLGPAKIDVRMIFPDDGSPINTAVRQRLLASSNMASPPAKYPLGELITASIANANMIRPLERLASLIPMQTYLAWLAHPSRDTQARLADHLVPRHSQLEIHHPAWVGMVLWGRLRCAIIHRQEAYGTDEFLRVYGTSLRLVNWPPSEQNATLANDYANMSVDMVGDALEIDPATGQVWLTEQFTAHASRLENWRLDMAFARRYPELGGLVDLVNLP